MVIYTRQRGTAELGKEPLDASLHGKSGESEMSTMTPGPSRGIYYKSLQLGIAGLT